MKQLETFQQWHHTRLGRGIFLVLELVLVYVLGSRAIDTGSWWEYLGTTILVIAAIRNVILLIKGK